MFGKYMIIRKSTLALAALAGLGLVGYHYYKAHQDEIRAGLDEAAGEVSQVAKKGAQKAKEVATEVKGKLKKEAADHAG